MRRLNRRSLERWKHTSRGWDMEGEVKKAARKENGKEGSKGKKRDSQKKLKLMDS